MFSKAPRVVGVLICFPRVNAIKHSQMNVNYELKSYVYDVTGITHHPYPTGTQLCTHWCLVAKISVGSISLGNSFAWSSTATKKHQCIHVISLLGVIPLFSVFIYQHSFIYILNYLFRIKYNELIKQFIVRTVIISLRWVGSGIGYFSADSKKQLSKI